MKKKPKKTISKEDIRKIQAGARRQVDIENGIGINRRHGVSIDEKKEANKNLCREEVEED